MVFDGFWCMVFDGFVVPPGTNPWTPWCPENAHEIFVFPFCENNFRQGVGLTLQRGASCYSHCDVPSVWQESQYNHTQRLGTHSNITFAMGSIENTVYRSACACLMELY